MRRRLLLGLGALLLGSCGAERLEVRVLPEVRKALDRGDPVVALESTIISHGMPYPQNFQTAQEVGANAAIPPSLPPSWLRETCLRHLLLSLPLSPRCRPPSPSGARRRRQSLC